MQQQKELEILIPSEVSQKEKGQIPYDMWNLKYGTNEAIYKTETVSQRTDLWLPRGGEREWMNWSVGLVDANYYM